jgi:exopolyphosphatase/guanosine-5'-triphosphate,3'-diphosphate pyrophosphatase
MVPETRGLEPASRAVGGPVAIIDIGSNSVRMVAHDGLTRAPTPIFNESVLCGLGRGLPDTGRLNPEGARLARATLKRFVALADAMEAELVDVVATAAVREATDGTDFVASIANVCGLDVRVLSGEEEGRLAALGVISGIPDADGVMGDIGGGSLELVVLDRGAPGPSATLPLGPLRLKTVGGTRAAQRRIDGALRQVPWLGALEGRAFYAVGGAWRALARLHIAEHDYPLRVLQNYTLPRDTMRALAHEISHLDSRDAARRNNIPRKRRDVLPLAALTLVRLLDLARPDGVVFSAYGLREGLVYDRLSPALQRQDPLIEGCLRLVAWAGRLPDHGSVLRDWTAPLFVGESASAARLRYAACILSDVAWRAQSDHRAEEALQQVLSAPLVGIDHAGRVFLGLAVHARYDGGIAGAAAARVQGMIGDAAATEARKIGLSLRLAHTLIPPSALALANVSLDCTGDRLTLRLSPAGRDLMGEVVRRRLDRLAEAFDKSAHVEVAA